MKQRYALDIIFVNYNSTDFLLKALASVCKNSDGHSARIQVIDNASCDGVGHIRSSFPDVHLIVNRCNRGFSAAVNQGLRTAFAPWVMIMNPDALVTPGFFKSAFTYLAQHPKVGVLGPRILNPDGSLQGSARAFPDLLTPLFARTSPLTRLFPCNRISRRNILTLDCDGHTPLAVDWVSGACMLARREAIDAVGPMDERFFMYWEDADWCRRMWDTGWQVVYYPRATAFHHVGASSSTQVFKSVIRFHQSSERLFKKYAHPNTKVFYPLAMSVLMLRLALALTVQCFRRLGRPAPQHLFADRAFPPLICDSEQALEPHNPAVSAIAPLEPVRSRSADVLDLIRFRAEHSRPNEETPLREESLTGQSDKAPRIPQIRKR